MSNATDKAMLVTLTVTKWSGRKLDRTVTEEVIASHGALPDAGRFNKLLVPKSSIAEIGMLESEIRARHYMLTLPFSDIGQRLLPVAAFWDYRGTMEGLKNRFVGAVDSFIAGYPTYVAEQKLALGSMFNEADYPSIPALRVKYSMKTDVMPLPSGDHLLVKIGEQEEAELRDHIEHTVAQRLEEAQKDCWIRVLDVVRHFASVMNDKDRRFQASTVEKIRQVCEIAPKLNIAGDQRLDTIVGQILNTIANYNPDDLRESSSARDLAAKQAFDAVKQIEEAMNTVA